MSITTRNGDEGRTIDFRGRRVSKADPSVELSGAFDEAEVALGLAIVAAQGAEGSDSAQVPRGCSVTHIAPILQEQQRALFACMAEIAGGEPFDSDERRLGALDDCVGKLDERLTPKGFILPGGSELAARLELARVTVRSCERRAVASRDAGLEVSGAVLAYLNRLSDFLFLAARLANASAGVEETAV